MPEREKAGRIPVSCPTWRRTLFDVEPGGISVRCRSCRGGIRHLTGWERIDQMRREIMRGISEGRDASTRALDLPGDLQIEMVEGLLWLHAGSVGSAMMLTPAQALCLLNWLREREMALRHWPLP